MKRYGQYCPVAKAAEVLAERWTLLVIRELLWGNERFNAIARGVPRMSPSLLASRLRELQRVGLVERHLEGGEPRYRLSEAGWELRPLVEGLGAWGQRWMHSLRPDDLDPSVLMLDMSRELDLVRERLPDPPVTVQIHLPAAEQGLRHWWLVLGRSGVDVCDVDPGFPVASWVRTDPGTLTRLWLGDLRWPQALRAGMVELSGDASANRALPGWLGVSRFAEVERAEVPLTR
jgi:DNA-binding HxlR family transcriptional regulator